ncbi:DUF2798 domain-containing protein [Psychromonas sp.]|uniref:DUF2798 domain-containing protein n=1 Tax=Psychromonas sp. TaxID=1884585 RepID=UPI0035684854
MAKIYYKIGIIASIVIVAGGMLTFAMTWRSVGFSDDFLSSWLSSFALSVVCVAPLGSVISVLVNKALVRILPRNISKVKLNTIFGLCMALIMESIMACVTTWHLTTISTMHEFITLWYSVLLTALPIGIVISVVLSLIIKPKLQLFWNS